MPRGDGTGPAGMGPMTGRAAGYCAGYQAPGFANPIPGRGYGFGRGMGMGYGRGMGYGFRGGRGGRWAAPDAWYGYGAPRSVPLAAAPTRQQQIDSLAGQAKYFEEALAEIQKRISDLQTESPEK